MRYLLSSSTIAFAFAIGIVVATQAVAQSRDTFAVACLRSEQRAEIADFARKLIAQLRIDEEIQSLKQLLDQQEARMQVALECKSRLENLFETLQATLEGCPGKIDQYNRTLREVEGKKSSISTRQDMVRAEIQNFRSSKYPPC
jgi:chromosome segregation ATPase